MAGERQGRRARRNPDCRRDAGAVISWARSWLAARSCGGCCRLAGPGWVRLPDLPIDFSCLLRSFLLALSALLFWYSKHPERRGIGRRQQCLHSHATGDK
jgi:hypothetical protein